MSGDGGGDIEVELQGRSIKWSDRSKEGKKEAFWAYRKAQS